MEKGSEDRMLKKDQTVERSKKVKPKPKAFFTCKRCGSQNHYVVNTWPASREVHKPGVEKVEVIHLIRRKRCCSDCGFVFDTEETTSEPLRRRKGKTPQPDKP